MFSRLLLSLSENALRKERERVYRRLNSEDGWVVGHLRYRRRKEKKFSECEIPSSVR